MEIVCLCQICIHLYQLSPLQPFLKFTGYRKLQSPSTQTGLTLKAQDIKSQTRQSHFGN